MKRNISGNSRTTADRFSSQTLTVNRELEELTGSDHVRRLRYADIRSAAVYHSTAERSFKKAAKDVFGQALLEYVLEREWELHAYLDYDVGRKSARPLFDLMMDHARQGKFNLVLFWSLDDFCHGTACEMLRAFEKLRNLHVQWLNFMELLEPVVDIKLTISRRKLRELTSAEDVADPAYLADAVAMRLAESERRSTKHRRIAAENKIGGRPGGRRPVVREKSIELFKAGKSPAAVIAMLGKSKRASVHRAYQLWNKHTTP